MSSIFTHQTPHKSKGPDVALQWAVGNLTANSTPLLFFSSPLLSSPLFSSPLLSSPARQISPQKQRAGCGSAVGCRQSNCQLHSSPLLLFSSPLFSSLLFSSPLLSSSADLPTKAKGGMWLCSGL